MKYYISLFLLRSQQALILPVKVPQCGCVVL